MTHRPEQDRQEILAALERALADESLAPETAHQGRQILERARAEVRIAVTGPPGSGKSHVAALLAGLARLPEGGTIPPLELRWGDAESASFALEGGGSETVSQLCFAPSSGAPARTLRLCLPLPALREISLQEIALPEAPDPAAQEPGATLARADIILWCGQDFPPQQQAFWAAMPDARKDHAFFVLSKADLLAEAGILAERIAALEECVAEEFHSLIPVATRPALAALDERGAPRDPQAWSASGGKALRGTILRQARLGRQAHLDRAALFLERLRASEGAACAPPPSPRPPSRPRRQPAPRAPEAAQAAEPAEALRPAHDLLREKALQMLEIARDNEDRAARILAECVAITREIARMLEPSPGAGPEADRLHARWLEAGDVMILLQMEDGIGPAADALSVLMQLRRDMEELIAA